MSPRAGACRGRPLMAVLLLLSIGCEDELNQERTASSMLADSAIVASLKSPPAVGRIVYEPPADLSMASAMTKRPDLFKPIVKAGNAAATEPGSRKSAPPAGAAGRRP
jgi:hypothetical protein